MENTSKHLDTRCKCIESCGSRNHQFLQFVLLLPLLAAWPTALPTTNTSSDSSGRKPAKTVEAFVDLFRAHVKCDRRPILVIIGTTNLGKSRLAIDTMKRIATILGVKGSKKVAVEGDARLDLSEFEITCHSGVLLDGVGDAQMLHNHHEALQGRAQRVSGGQVGHDDVRIPPLFVLPRSNCDTSLAC